LGRAIITLTRAAASDAGGSGDALPDLAANKFFRCTRHQSDILKSIDPVGAPCVFPELLARASDVA
jgi:hypothetical protein